MTEAVDRLELVTDGEDLARPLPGGEQIDELALQRVRVLEFVDHHDPEAKLLGLEHGGVGSEQIARRELEILEVDDRLTVLRLRVCAAKPQQLLEQIAVTRRELLERGALELPCARDS